MRQRIRQQVGAARMVGADMAMISNQKSPMGVSGVAVDLLRGLLTRRHRKHLSIP